MWSVLWAEEALNELAARWLAADSPLRQAITATTNEIDHLLATDPYRECEAATPVIRCAHGSLSRPSDSSPKGRSIVSSGSSQVSSAGRAGVSKRQPPSETRLDGSSLRGSG